MNYDARVVAIVEDRAGVGSLDPSDPTVFTGMAIMGRGAHAVRLQGRVDASGVICECVFKACGSPATIACAAQAVRLLAGNPWSELSRLHPELLLAQLNLPRIRYRNALLVCSAAQTARTSVLLRRHRDAPDWRWEGDALR